MQGQTLVAQGSGKQPKKNTMLLARTSMAITHGRKKVRMTSPTSLNS